MCLARPPWPGKPLTRFLYREVVRASATVLHDPKIGRRALTVFAQGQAIRGMRVGRAKCLRTAHWHNRSEQVPLPSSNPSSAK